MARLWSVVLAAFVSFAVPPGARADVVTEWNDFILLNVPGLAGQRALTMAHLAMFDAVNSIDRGYTRYLVLADAPHGASPDAAAAAAAYGVLSRVLAAPPAGLQARYAALLVLVPDGQGKTDGIALGDAVAAALVAARADDHILDPNPPYVAGTGPGVYQLTGPPPVNTGAFRWRPFAMATISQFRANGPLPVTHPKYVDDLEEVRELGSAASTTRTEEQALSARWHVEMAHLGLNRVARAAVAAEGPSLVDSARLFALLNMAMMDGVAAVFEAKYFYNYWRPITAIRNAADDGNPATEGDPTWQSLLGTPPHPEYPSAHGYVSASGVAVLNAVFGQHYGFETTSSAPGMAGIARWFDDFEAFNVDAQVARIYGGMHFRTAVVEGAKQGRKIGKWVLENYLVPVP